MNFIMLKASLLDMDIEGLYEKAYRLRKTIDEKTYASAFWKEKWSS